MKFYMAPMEGITGYIYRNAYHTYFHHMDKYVTPFIAPNQNRCLNTREQNDILPEHNKGMKVVPQILTNRAEDFIRTVKELKTFGYDEVNLNMGCPSRTVVAKKRGAGFLAETKLLDEFLDQIFNSVDIKISIKTRIGKESPDEFIELLRIFNKYRLEELMIHPRMQTDYYKNKPNLEIFSYAEKESKNHLCYNGDIFTKSCYEDLKKSFPDTDTIMLGRGVLVNPGLVDQICKDTVLDKKLLKNFHDQIYKDYQEVLSGERNVLFKMKELWFYMIHSFSNHEKYAKKIKKSERLKVYEEVIGMLFKEQELII